MTITENYYLGLRSIPVRKHFEKKLVELVGNDIRKQLEENKKYK